MSAEGQARLAGFPPVIDAGCETLILGSFPGAASLASGHYYAHPRNQFWPILSACLDEPLASLPFDERYVRVLRHRIAIWDVIASCRRPGSLDADIRDARENTLDAVLARAPRLRSVLFNGRTAARGVVAIAACGLATRVLPSTSPANAGMSFEEKLAVWRAALEGRTGD